MRTLKKYLLDPQQWLMHIATTRQKIDISSLEKAIALYQDLDINMLHKGLSIANRLLFLALDDKTLVAALLYPAIQTKILTLEKVIVHFDEEIRRILRDAMRMQTLGMLQHVEKPEPKQIENIRKMLLAIVSDTRSVLIVLAEHLWQLQQAKQLQLADQKKLAQTTLDVYAPLANRLGIWQLKWEIEDLCLRYLQPSIYKRIAKSLMARREERENYIQEMQIILTTLLKQTNITHFQISGRVKHIYSIYQKMQLKRAHFSDLYDISALRILVPEIADCYVVLSMVINHWQQLPQEFSDYIARPKPNGYRSIHTVIIGPHHKPVEIQIRTLEMHREAELGVAAHWRYKEGLLTAGQYEEKIVLLRQLMTWQQEMASSAAPKQVTQDLFADRVYVFTPAGEVLDLPAGATPLDFAYHIHSEIGHRCRGVKVNDKMVPLAHVLQTGDRVEILTAKQPHPSRDWLNLEAGYLTTPRARSCVQHWFRQQEGIVTIPRSVTTGSSHPIHQHHTEASKASSPTIQILGINNLLTHLAHCCHPQPNDAIIGYVTQYRGVSIHRSDCENISRLTPVTQKRLIQVNWSQ